jgi:hypothetical protein
VSRLTRTLASVAASLSFATVSVAQEFRPGEKVTASSSGLGPTSSGMVDGAAYEYTADLEGHIVNGAVDAPGGTMQYGSVLSERPARWVVVAKRDPMTDRTTWYMNHYRTGLMMGLTKTGAIRTACIIGADFPGRAITVRVGTAPPWKFSGDCSSNIPAGFRAQLMKGGRLLTRGYEWPYDFPKDKDGTADNFAAAMNLYLYLRSGVH